jgi:O-antigen/teichoic acid export membrane protein
MAPVAFGIVCLVTACLPWTPLRTNVVLIVAVYQICFLLFQIVVARFLAYNEMGTAGAIDSSLHFTILVGTLVAIGGGASLPIVLLVFPAAVLIHMLVAFRILARKHPRLVWRLDFAFLRQAWSHIWPFGLASLMGTAYLKIDVMVIGFLRDEVEVGIYAAGHRLVFGVITLLGVISGSTFPVFSRLFTTSKSELGKAFGNVLNYWLIGSGFFMVACLCLSEPLIHVLYGPRFTESVNVLRLCSALLVLTSLNVLLAYFLASIDRQRIAMRGLMIGIPLNVALNVLLVSRYGYIGAAIATITVEIVVVSYYYGSIVRSGFGAGFARKAARLALAGGLAVGAYLLVDLGWPGFAVGAIVYFAVTTGLRGIRRSELAVAWGWVTGRE